MRILLTNDDGIHSPGLLALARTLARRHQVVIIAPDRERSAIGHAITIHHPLRVEEAALAGFTGAVYVLNGTPSDCVKLGLEVLFQDVDLVISGINRGPNLGTDVFYSGTVSAALEAGMKGLSAFAVSLLGHENFAFNPAAEFLAGFLEYWEANLAGRQLILNINIPDLPLEELNGFKFVKLGSRKYKNIFEKREDPRGKVYYWQAGEASDDLEEPETDLVAVKEGIVAITPLEVDLTCQVSLDFLQGMDSKN